MATETAQKMKFKGRLKNITFSRLLYHSGDFFGGDFDVLVGKPTFLPKGSGVIYSTRKADFFAKRKNARYWEVWQIVGGI